MTERFVAGKAVYNARCYFCHGYAGDAKTLAATYLEPPPTDFTSTSPDKLTRRKMVDTVTHGRADTAMMGFGKLLTADEIELVVDFIRSGFMRGKVSSSYYHTPENGWENHDRYRIAFPFALGEIALDTPDEELSEEQRRGKHLFMSACVTCHDRAKVRDEGEHWDPRAVSFPRGGYAPGKAEADAQTGATPYAKHDIPRRVDDLDEKERLGESLFQQNCAFCHAADGTGKNWIGSFLEPHPRNLTDPEVMNAMTREHLIAVIRDGLPGTTMSAWKSVLTDEQIDAIVAYIDRALHTLADRKPENADRR